MKNFQTFFKGKFVANKMPKIFYSENIKYEQKQMDFI